MMTGTDTTISELTVPLSDPDSGTPIGTGVLYYHPGLKEKLYLLTAAHNLFRDPASFREARKEIKVAVFDPAANSYQFVTASIDQRLVSAREENDYAAILLNSKDVLAINPSLPVTKVLRNPEPAAAFVIKGFPEATKGQELASIRPAWVQVMTGSERFQLELTEDYDSYSTKGFSGSGVFVVSGNEVFLTGIFTRLREEGKGKVIYCQYIYAINELLERNFQPLLHFTFLGGKLLSPSFFEHHIQAAKARLGPRFNEKLNVNLPVALLFDDLAKNSKFKRRLLNLIDSYLVPKRHSSADKFPEITDIEDAYAETKRFLASVVSSFDWSPPREIKLDEVIKRIDELTEKAQKKRRELYDKRWKEEKSKPDLKKDYNYQPPYTREINRLGEIIDSNSDFAYAAGEVIMALANDPFLILHGEAGCGKSHLLGDIANERWKQGKPSLLLLGQLFKNSSTAWQNIITQLDLQCTKEELLTWLDSIGRQLNERLIVLIDALNEGDGKEIWPDQLAGFIEDVSRYRFIGVAVSVRSTYLDIIVRKDIKERKDVTLFEHEGFKGNEYAAIRLFCAHYKLEQPNFPILAPEFSNPLFLWLTCEGIVAAGGKKFPSGFHGISKMYQSYVDSVIGKLAAKREEYQRREHIIRQAITEFAQLCFFHEHSNTIPLKDAVTYFDQHFKDYRYLLNDLIFENILVQNSRTEYDTDEHTEILYFAFERVGDYFMAQELLKPYATKEEVLAAFAEGTILGNLVEKIFWRTRGIIEVFATLLPEKYEIEIFEAYVWVFEKAEGEEPYSNYDHWLNHALLDSLKWRTLESIGNDKITAWIRGKRFRGITYEDWFNFLITLAPVEGHPFNGDRFTDNLMRYTMAERDGFWQNHMRYYSGVDDHGSGYPIHRLLDWAWQPGVSTTVSPEVARLTGQTLAWLLSSTYIMLRDQATKAMVNLLEQQPSALLQILDRFRGIDDMYILERLYGVCYGCALRTTRENGLRDIAAYVYENIFKDCEPPVHVLLRDYARNVVEYAIHKGVAPEGDMSLIRPPYQSKMPTDILNEEDLTNYEKDDEDPDFKSKGYHYYNQIRFSVMGWDFGRYTVNSALRDFCAYSFTTEAAIKTFMKELTPDQRRQVKILKGLVEIKEKLVQRNNRFGKMTISEHDQKIIDFAIKEITETEERLSKMLSAEQLSFVERILKSHLASVERAALHSRSFDPEPMKRWIVKRAHELGYDPKLHSQYEAAVSTYGERHENKIERIGKKYQWIALYEAVARVADNYKIQEGWSESRRYIFYPGPWTGYLRDIDPIFTTRNQATDEDSYDSIDTPATDEWWIDRSYHYWNGDSANWVAMTEDLHDPKGIIHMTDPEGNEWILLNSNIHWHEPRPFGKDRYKITRKEIWYLLQAYFVRKADKKRTLTFLQGKSFWNRWMPESYSANMSIFTRENYWSPAAKAGGRQTWQTLRDSNLKVKVATAKAVGEMSKDKSGAHYQYEMPCQLLFEKLGLQYSATDGEFQTAKGEVVVISPSQTEGTVLIRKDVLQIFLDENNLEIIWTLLGEKNALSGSFGDGGDNFFKVINGVYSLEGGAVAGSLRLDNRD